MKAFFFHFALLEREKAFYFHFSLLELQKPTLAGPCDGDDGDNIDDVVDDGVGDDFDCDVPGPAPAGQATQQPQPAEQRIQ